MLIKAAIEGKIERMSRKGMKRLLDYCKTTWRLPANEESSAAKERLEKIGKAINLPIAEDKRRTLLGSLGRRLSYLYFTSHLLPFQTLLHIKPLLSFVKYKSLPTHLNLT